MKTKLVLLIVIGIVTSCFTLYVFYQMHACLFPSIETHRPGYTLDFCFELLTGGYL